jgi:hypothetical protein
MELISRNLQPEKHKIVLPKCEFGRGCLDILHEADEMQENLQCYGNIDINSDEDGTDQWAHILKLTTTVVQIFYTNN